MKREAEESWASERVENSLLRERINDVAAEVARLASALEGPNSPIDAILAAESARDRASLVTDGEAEAGAAPAGGNLADRIRALQTHASRAAARGRAERRRIRRLLRAPNRHPGLTTAASLDTPATHSLYRRTAMAGRLAQRESTPFTRVGS